MRGTVKWFNSEKGYGFITDDNGTDYFVHYSSICMDGFKYLTERTTVDFELAIGKNGREQAVNVNRVNKEKQKEIDTSDVQKAFAEQATKAIVIAGMDDMVTEGLKKSIDLKDETEDYNMSKSYEEKYGMVVKAVTQESEDCIMSKYNQASENLKNLTPDDKKFLMENGVTVDETTDLPTVLEVVKAQWSTYSDGQKVAVSRAVVGEKSAHDMMVYMEAMEYMEQ